MKEQILKEFEDKYCAFKLCNQVSKPELDKLKNFISKAISQTREETIREMEEKEIEIQNILEPYFVVLDGRDNEPSQETIIEISKKILDILNKLKK